MADFKFLFVQFLNGISIGMLLYIIASGLALLYGVLGLLNLAHGSFYMLAAHMIFTCYVLKFQNWFLFGLIVIPTLISGLAILLERFFLSKMYKREQAFFLLFTFAWVLVFDDLALIIWGREFISITLPKAISGSIKIFGKDYPHYYLLICILGPLVALGQWLLINKTKLGVFVRARASDELMLNSLGINTKTISTIIFAIGSWLAAFGGVLSAPLKSISSGMGLNIIIEAFIVVVIGGMGSLMGPLVASFMVGQIQAFGIIIIPRYTMILLYTLLAFVLLVKPQGLFGAKE